MFIVEGGVWNFDLFDSNAGFIQLLFVLICQSVFIPWMVGIEKLSTLIEIATGDKIPKFYIFVIRVIVPIFAVLMFILGVINETDTEKRLCQVDTSTPELAESTKGCMNWSSGHLWGARLIWLG